MESRERSNTPTGLKETKNHPSKERTSTQSHPSKFRFKSTKHSSRKRTHSPSTKPREKTHKRRPPHRTTTHLQDDLNPTSQPLSPDAAFRESLFDAMGDDEGAAYWEGVYGQPIHNFAIPETRGPNGELEQMDEEEYAAYVRARMWERTREGMLDEHAKWREERRRNKMRSERGRAEDAERMSFERAMEDSLRRGTERKKRKKWEGAWEMYLARWEEIAKIVKEVGMEGKEEEEDAGEVASTATAGSRSKSKSKVKPLRNLLFWPVESGKRVDVAPESVEEFMRHASSSEDLMTVLKAERVRWHPDKIQHRYSGLGIDDIVMRSVTEVFQIVDRMWNELRERKT
ncbi:hypothetical protein N7454_007724 [Penicillium verhagenii]|nr:hypothetical protein N7454_007724 [Penicillium verhagenii]